MELKNRIKELRAKSRLTQRELAEKAETSQQQIQRIEAGVQAVRVDLAMKIAKALNAQLPDVFPIGPPPSNLRGAKLEEAFEEKMAEVGLDHDSRHWRASYRVRGGASGWLSISSIDKRRLRYIVAGQREGFMIFDAEDMRYAIQHKHLMYMHFLFETPNVIVEKKEQPESGFKAQFYLIDSPEPLEFDVDPDKKEDGQLGWLFKAAAGDDDEDPIHFTNADGEEVFLRRDDVAMFSIPLHCVEPRLRKAMDNEDEIEKASP
jgi:DNA-binding XRE family transcriptional regulator